MYRLFNNDLIQYPLFDVDDVVVPSGELTKEGMIELMGEDDDKVDTLDLEKPTKEKDDVKDDEKKDEVDEEVDELKDLEEELEDIDDEKLELVTPVRRSEILKKYPQLFKDFPYLEKAYYREQQFTELLPTINDAKEAVEKSQTLDRFESDLLAGNTESILKAAKDTDPNAFYKIVDNYLPTLSRVDEKAYYHVIGNVIKSTIRSMVQEARSNEANKTLEGAAQLLNQFVFGSSTWTAPTNLSKTDDTKDNKSTELEERERSFNERQFTSAKDDLSSRVNNIIKSTIEGHIDPKDSMTDYVKRNAIKDAMGTLDELIASDNRFKSLVDKLWERSVKENFSKKSLDDIRSAYTSKAKSLLPDVIKKARNEALKGLGGRKVSDDKNDSNESNEDKRVRKSTSSSNSGPVKAAKDIPKNMKTLDFLMQD